jgi:polysaccharide export outer membrane protein
MSLALALAALSPALAQPQSKPEARSDAQKKEQKRTTTGAPKAAERLEPDDNSAPRPGMSQEAQANRIEQQSEEEAAVVPYYNNFLSEYKLGPEDVVSISVFDQPRYSKDNITIPPDGRLAYWFVPGGLHVAGKTTQQIGEELTRHLDEYIIDPKVVVTLEKAQSATFAVLGDVAQPGVRPMTKRLTVYEALLQAGGVLGTGNKKKVVLVRHGNDRMLDRRIIDVAAIERGKSPDNMFLAAGDQLFVPGNRMKTLDKIISLMPVISFARIFTGGF